MHVIAVRTFPCQFFDLVAHSDAVFCRFVLRRFNQLRVVVMLLVSCVPMLLNVVSLLSFIFFVFGIIAVQIWQGVLRGRCYGMDDGLALDLMGDMVHCSEGTGVSFRAKKDVH